MMNVHETHAVLWAVRKRVQGMKYKGMGTARDRIAKRKTVTGNPKDRGHLMTSFVSQAEAAWPLHGNSYHLPVQSVKVKNFGYPDQRAEVVEAIVNKQEEPKVDLHAGRTVTRCLAVKCRHSSCKSQPNAALAVAIVAIVRERVLREGNCAPGNGLSYTSVSLSATAKALTRRLFEEYSW